ncbi:methylase [Thioploca ingrica]|uniref:Methylase n=1 Tax=Thioploca ingrica TaxID=40754 RepID=A0A090AJ76_9GAMM|nr:methylase [Thioploca ingrica]
MKPLKLTMQQIWRQRRMSVFLMRMKVKNGYKIIDLGGTPELWETVDLDLEITLLNLSHVTHYQPSTLRHSYQFITGDACHINGLIDNTFDLVFSNSVIEHVGPVSQQQAFAETVRQLAPRYWIQTPSLWFPIEAHCNLPLWWFYPQFFQQAWIRRWQQQGREFLWRQMTETRLLTLNRLKFLFPEAQVYTEYVVGFPKSYSMYYL